MLPYFPQPSLKIGSITIYAFSSLVFIGTIVGIYLALFQERYYRLNADPHVQQELKWAQWASPEPNILKHLIGICLLVGLPLSHVFSVLFYAPTSLYSHPYILFDLSKGISSFGGFLGFAIGFIFYTVYIRAKRIQIYFLPYLDCLAYGFTACWCIARFGCTLAHDHPGKTSHSFLVVDYPPTVFGGIPRYNLGFIEMLGTIIIFVLLHLISRKTKTPGIVASVLLIVYSTFRFFIEFLKATDLPQSDIHYYYLTPAQWGCIILFVLGMYTFSKARTMAKKINTTLQG